MDEPPNWDDLAEGWDNIDGTEIYSRYAFAEVQQRIGLTSKAHVLDFGCGTGLLTEKLLKVTPFVTAVDTSSVMISKLRQKHPDIDSYSNDIRNLSKIFVRQWILRFLQKE